MKKRRKKILAAFAAGGILLFALDSQTAVSAAKEAVLLCGQAILPSLFPMFFLCTLLTGNIHVQGDKSHTAPGKLFSLHSSNTLLLVTSFLGGYPTGAQSVALAYHRGNLSKHHATRILACCNQAGPAFIFGILGSQFDSGIAPWAVWAVQIISALLLLSIFGSSDMHTSPPLSEISVSPAEALNTAICAILRVCGWVILFRCMIGYIGKLFVTIPNINIQVLATGLLELTNGCLLLSCIDNESIRFILCSILLTFGGACVTFQTKSVISDLPIIPYLSGKILQTLITFILSTVASALLYRTDFPAAVWISAVICLCLISIYTVIEKKTVAFQRKKVYNNASNV